MGKVEVNKLECRYPAIFKVMWLAVVVWMVVGILAIDAPTKRVASYAFMVSFAVLMVTSIWEICGTTNNNFNFTRNGAVTLIPLNTVFSIVGDILKASALMMLSYLSGSSLE